MDNIFYIIKFLKFVIRGLYSKKIYGRN